MKQTWHYKMYILWLFSWYVNLKCFWHDMAYFPASCLLYDIKKFRKQFHVVRSNKDLLSLNQIS